MQTLSSLSISLTKKQEAFVTSTLEKLENNEGPKSVITLSGAAGTGKTTVLVELIRRATTQGYRCLVTAPTHKALHVLGSKLENGGASVPLSTLHSALCLKPKPTIPGQPEEFQQTSTPKLDNLDMIVIDEASMIGRALLRYVMRYMVGKFLVVFAGDVYQLRPVGESSKSAVFKQLFDENSTITHEIYRLTKVLRHDGAILDFATQLRKSSFVLQVGPAQGDNSEIKVYETNDQMKKVWLKTLKTMHDRDMDTDSVCMLCFKNDNRRKLNAAARAFIYGPDVPEFMEGDRIVALNAWSDAQQRMIPNNASLQVNYAEYVQGYMPIPDLGPNYAFDSWILHLSFDNKDFDCRVLARHEHARFRKRISALARDIKKGASADVSHENAGGFSEALKLFSAKSQKSARARWATEFFPLKEHYIDVDFDYVRTIHKSQGSTFEQVFILDDYMDSRGEAVSLGYVAFTRASRVVHHRDTRIATLRARRSAA